MNFKHRNSSTIYVYLVEGSAEKYIIDSLLKSDSLKNNFRPENIEFQHEIIDVGGGSNLNYDYFSYKTSLSQSDKRQVHFVIIGDKLKPNIMDFVGKNENVLFRLYGVKYHERISIVTINPEPEILYLTNEGISTKGITTSSKLKKIFESKMDISFEEAKSYKQWRKIESSKISRIISNTFFPKKTQAKNFYCISEIVKK